MRKLELQKGLSLYPGEISSGFDRAIFGLDNAISGNTELSAIEQLKINGNIDTARKTALSRVGAMGLTGAEIVARAAEVYGLSSVAPSVEIGGVNIPIVAVLGFVGEGVAYLSKNRLLNEIGSSQNTEMLRMLKETSSVRPQVYSGLLEAGYTQEQIKKLDSLPLDLYNTMFGTTNRQTVANILNPISVGIAMSMYGDKVLGSLIAGVGLSGFPLGDWLYAKSSSRISRKLDLSTSAKNYVYRTQVYLKEYFPQTFRTNLLTISPQFIKAGALLLGATDNLARLTGVNNALLGLAGLLTAMRTKYSNVMTVGVARKLIETVNSPSFLFRPSNYIDHAETAGNQLIELPTPDFSGLVVKGMKVKLPSGKSSGYEKLTFHIESGKVLVIKGKSGEGKSVLLSGITQVLDHDGQVVLAENGAQTNVHEFANSSDPMKEINDRIIVGSVRNIDQLAQVIDVLTPAFNAQYEMPEFESEQDQLEFDVGITIANNLLRKEVSLFENPTSKRVGLIKVQDKAMFSDQVMSELSRYYNVRRDWVAGKLSSSGEFGNLANGRVTSESAIEQLSDGERKRLMLLSVCELVEANTNAQVVLLDEPLSGLDSDTNIPLVIESIKKLAKVRGGIAVGIITHDHVDKLQNQLDAKVIELESGIAL